jgi:adenylate cyclase
MTNPPKYTRRPPETSRPATDRKALWPTYVGITGLLLVILIALAGGIIWFNSIQFNELAIAATKRQMEEAQDKIIERIKLLYEPIYAILGVGSLVPQLTSPSIGDDPRGRELTLRALRLYPQIRSLYVGFDNGDFHMVTHIAGDRSAALRASLQAPNDAVFAVNVIAAGVEGRRESRWSFLSEEGAVVGRRDPTPASFDPRRRPWYEAARSTDIVEESDLYIFASSSEPGFTLSRRFNGPTAGVIGADLATSDLTDFLRGQKITASSAAFIFTRSGAVVAAPRLPSTEASDVKQTTVMPLKIS